MTRYAKVVHGTHRKPQEATPWSELRPKDNDKHRGVDKKSKKLKKNVTKTQGVEGESQGADYRRSKSKKRKPQWKKTEWEMLETGKAETRGLAADLLKIDEDEKNPTLYRPAKVAEKQRSTKSLSDRLKAIQEDHGHEFSKDQKANIAEVLKKDDRRENRRLKRVEERTSVKTCFHCRGEGHDMASCPKMNKDVEQGTGICFKCGSTEHAINTCTVKLPPGEFPYAKCFICGELGHLSKQCPDNPRGLYPNGGCCRGCGSVEHYNKDCPAVLKEEGFEGITVSRLSWNTNTEEDEELAQKKPTQPQKKKAKVVKF